MPRKTKPIAVIDFETDPFRFDRKPEPFCVQFLSDKHCKQFWGDDCALSLANWLEELEEPHTIFAHNGGKFDFWFLQRFISNPLRVINARIVSAKLFQHELRDSYSILPVPLRAYEKDEIDYRVFERDKRNKHKVEILRYLHSDCRALLDLVQDFVDTFGLKLTVASTAMSDLKSRYSFSTLSLAQDESFRPFYFGGRVQCFETGLLRGPFEAYDVNSSYPKSMRDYKHPINGSFEIGTRLPRDYKRPFFVRFIGEQTNALPFRGEDNSLVFTQQRGEFFACSHELELALDHKLVKIEKVIEVRRAIETISFEDYIDHWYARKVQAQKAGDKKGIIFAKLMLNSAYGRFGINPRHFKDWRITHDDAEEIWCEDNGFARESDFDGFALYSRQATIRDSALCDVTVAASITSASRAQLLEGLQKATRPIYCDTDSIICESFGGEISSTVLGGWKHEATAKRAVVCGKKLYALYDTPKEAIKLASKGGSLTLKDLIAIANGDTVHYERDAPTFSLKGPVRFVTRRFKLTG